MKSRIRFLFEMLRSKFWLLPAAITTFLLGLNLLINSVGNPAGITLGSVNETARLVSTEGQRIILSSIAGVVITVVGVLFSITVVVLQQVSAQYSPRVIENFRRSLQSQGILGVHLGTFGFAILQLEQLNSETEKSLPIGTLIVIGLAVICLFSITYYIHYLTQSIKSNTILANIRDESIQAIKDLAREFQGFHAVSTEDIRSDLSHRHVIRSDKAGYLQDIRWDKLKTVLKETASVLEVERTAGDYINFNMTLLSVRSQKPLPKPLEEKIRNLFSIGITRTHTQDIKFGIRQMVDVAQKALSPGINDPTTSVEVLNEIGNVLVHLNQLETGLGILKFEGESTLVIHQPRFIELIELSFNEILVSGRNFVVVLRRVEQVLSFLIQEARDPSHIQVLEEKKVAAQAALAKARGRDLYV